MDAAATGVIGRATELAGVTAFLDAIPEGPAAHVLTGEAGVGKTTLWRAGVDLALERGLPVLASRPSELEVRLPFAGLGDLLSGISPDAFAALPPAPRRALDLAVLRAEPDGSPLEQRSVGVGLLGLLRWLAAHGPVLVAVDDSQWLDEPTSGALRFAARRLATEPVGLLVAARTMRDDVDHLGIRRSLPPGRVTTTEVRPLPRPAVDRLLHERLRLVLPEATRARLYALSGGNPFFALEIGRALERQAPSVGAPIGLPVPDTLRELVLERLYRLPGTVRDILVIVSALSNPTLELLATVTGDGQASARAVERAEDAGVLEVDNARVRFVHPLLGSVLHGELGTGERRRLHRRLAERVTDPDERARHLALGTIVPDEAIASELEGAAARTRARGAPDAAGFLAEEARRLTPTSSGPARTRRTLAAADAYLDAGMSARASNLLEPLVEELGPSADQARALHVLGRVRMFESGLRMAEPVLERAAAAAGDDAPLQAAIGRDLGVALGQTGDLRRARAVAEATLGWARRTDQPDLVASAGVHLASIEFLLGNGIREDLLPSVPRPAPAPVGTGSASTSFVPVDLVWGALLKWSDQFDLARERFAAVRRAALATGDETGWIPLTLQAGELELWAGDWDAAWRIAEEGRLASGRRPEAMQLDHAYLVAAIEAHRGNAAAAREAAAASLAQASSTGDRRLHIRAEAVLGFIDLSSGDAHGAVTHLGVAHDLFREAAYGDPGVIRFVPELIEALVLEGDPARAASLRDWLAERGHTLRRPYALATAARCGALLLASEGRVEEALGAVEDALRHHADLPQPFELARTRLVHGALLRRAKAKREARAELGLALAAFEGLGAALWADRTRAELGRISGRGPTASGLTATEATVARLAASGYGNREIAEALVVSPKTVEAHLTRVYDKLEVRSRGELIRRSRSGEFPDVSDVGAT